MKEIKIRIKTSNYFPDVRKMVTKNYHVVGFNEMILKLKYNEQGK